MHVLVIKSLGSKRRLVGELGTLFEGLEATTALDAFTGTTRVAQEFCRRGGSVKPSHAERIHRRVIQSARLRSSRRMTNHPATADMMASAYHVSR